MKFFSKVIPANSFCVFLCLSWLVVKHVEELVGTFR